MLVKTFSPLPMIAVDPAKEGAIQMHFCSRLDFVTSCLLLAVPALASGCAAVNSEARLVQANVDAQSAAVDGSQSLDTGNVSDSVAEFCQTAAEEYAAAGQTSEAIAMFEQAQRHDPSLADANAHHLAVLHAEAGHTNRAHELFQRAVNASPRNADVLNDFGYFLLTQGDIDQARANFQRACDLSPNHPQATMNLGLLAARNGDIQQASAQFRQIVDPDSAAWNAGILSSATVHAIQ